MVMIRSTINLNNKQEVLVFIQQGFFLVAKTNICSYNKDEVIDMRGVADEEVIVLSPDRLGYKDRGIMKWQGLILSDHIEAMKKEKAASRREIVIEEEQDEQEIGEQLFMSLAHKKWISVQENILDGSDYVEPVVGVVLGFKEPYVFIQTKKERKRVSISDIRHIKSVSYDKWASL